MLREPFYNSPVGIKQPLLLANIDFGSYMHVLICAPAYTILRAKELMMVYVVRAGHQKPS